MSDDLSRLETWAAPMLEKLDAKERRALARDLANRLRVSQRERIKRQENPDGSDFEPRKFREKEGRIKRKPMFIKMRRNSYLKARYSASGISVGFFFPRVARIARIHQKGLRDRVRRGGPDVRYEQRELLGFSVEDLDLIENGLVDYFAVR